MKEQNLIQVEDLIEEKMKGIDHQEEIEMIGIVEMTEIEIDIEENLIMGILREIMVHHITHKWILMQCNTF